MTLLSEIGEALYGPRWQSELARVLGVNIRTAQRWAAGDTTPPPGVYADLAKIAGERRISIGTLLPRLKEASQP